MQSSYCSGQRIGTGYCMLISTSIASTLLGSEGQTAAWASPVLNNRGKDHEESGSDSACTPPRQPKADTSDPTAAPPIDNIGHMQSVDRFVTSLDWSRTIDGYNYDSHKWLKALSVGVSCPPIRLSLLPLCCLPQLQVDVCLTLVPHLLSGRLSRFLASLCRHVQGLNYFI